MFSDESYPYAGLIEARDESAHMLELRGVHPIDIDEALDIRALFRLRADGFTDAQIAADLPQLLS